MALCYFPLLVVFTLIWANTALRVDTGCSLKVPNHVKNQMEPSGDIYAKPKPKPLLIEVDIMVLGVRDVPDNGGSYGVDVK